MSVDTDKYLDELISLLIGEDEGTVVRIAIALRFLHLL